MIDTIRAVWPHETIHHQVPPYGWTFTGFSETSSPVADVPTSRKGFKYHHITSGLVASGSRQLIKNVQVSLPRALFGTNARLITSDDELDQALQITGEILERIGEPMGGIDHFTRVDLCWQLRLDPRLVILAHRHARHPNIRSNAGHYDGQSQYWAGSGLYIRMYDKALKETRQPGDIVRIEFELHNQLLQKLLGNGAPFKKLDFNKAYAAYRELMLGFCPSNVPTISDIADLLAMAEAEKWSYQGLPLFDLWSQGKNAEHVRRVQKQIASLRPQYFNINWAEILPVDGPPEAVGLDNAEVLR
jgi:hypothetical protein